MSEIVKPIILDETGQAIAEAIGRISRHAESADTATTAENAQKLGNKLPSEYAEAEHTHTKEDITDFPTSLPASDVPTWAKQPTKPTYTASEVGALPASGKATDSDLLDGHDSTYFASASSLSLNGYGTESGGSNIWDEKWKNGYYNFQTGRYVSNANYICSADGTRIGQNVSCYIVAPNNTTVLFYDENDGYIGFHDMNISNPSTRVFTTPSNTAYFHFYEPTQYGNVYKHDIAIIEGTSGSYSPYFSSNKSLTDRIDRDFELERFGYVCPIINGIRNFVDSDGVLHRKIARVDLGSLSYGATDRNRLYSASIYSIIKKPSSNSVVGNIYCDRLHADSSNNVYSNATDNSIAVADNGALYIYASAYTDNPSAFKSAMSGVYLYYELSTEETYSAYDTPSVQSMISDEWQSGTTYSVGSYCIDENVLYKCLVPNSGQKPKTSPTYWQPCKVTDGGKQAIPLLGNSFTTFVALANSLEKDVRHVFQLNVTNYTDKPSGSTSWFAYLDVYCSSNTGFIFLKYMSNQGEWSGFANATTVTWTRIA